MQRSKILSGFSLLALFAMTFATANGGGHGSSSPGTHGGTKSNSAGTSGAVHVNGYTRSNGTYVAPHMRSAPDGNPYNNWTAKDNINPYTGTVGTRDPNSSTYYQRPLGYYGGSTNNSAGIGGAVYVQGYTRSNGTYVAPHMRSAPDGDPFNNWSTKGNINPYTGVAGTHNPYPTGYSPNTYSQPPIASMKQGISSGTQPPILTPVAVTSNRTEPGSYPTGSVSPSIIAPSATPVKLVSNSNSEYRNASVL